MEREAMQELLDRVSKSIGLTQVGDEHAIAIVPEGFSVKDVREMLPPPARPREQIEILTPESFIAYVLRYGKPLKTVVFANEIQGAYNAVIDYHTHEGARGTCDHRVNYRCPPSPEWKTWTGNSGKLISQADFAAFIENNLPDIVAPSSADMLQIALTLQIKKNAAYSSDLRLDNGQTQFRYEEEIRGQTKAGDLNIPDTFLISIPVFVGQPRENVTARLRYRLAEQKLQIGYELVRSAQVRDQAVQAVTNEIRDGLDGFPIFIGAR